MSEDIDIDTSNNNILQNNDNGYNNIELQQESDLESLSSITSKFSNTSKQKSSSNNNSYRNSSQSSPILSPINSPQSVEKEATDTKRFWKSIGIIFQFCGVLAVIFTVFLGLYLDKVINWNFWLLFTPVYFILFVGFIATGSKTLSKIVSWVIRFIWRVWIIGITLFIAFLIVRMEYGKLTDMELLIPLFATFGLTFLMGIYSIGFGACFAEAPSRKRKYIMSGIPMFFTGATLIPSIILIALKYHNVNSTSGFHPNWSICFIPLFIGDAISGCFSFFLLLFTYNSKDNASFSFTQLLSVLFIILCSIVFKILYSLKLDNPSSKISFISLFIPVLVGELFLIFCGVNLFIRPAKTNYNINNDEVIIIESDSEDKPLIKKPKK